MCEEPSRTPTFHYIMKNLIIKKVMLESVIFIFNPFLRWKIYPIFHFQKQAYTFPWLLAISYSTQGTETMVSNLDSDKASGPDRVHLFILKHGANEIYSSYIYLRLYTQSLSTSSLPAYWLTVNI